MKQPKTGRISMKEGRRATPPKKVAAPKGLTGKLKQTEGFTPPEALSNPRKAGLLRSSQAREKRLSKVPM